MTAMEKILEQERTDLLGKLLILPITTMDGYKHPMPTQDWIKAHPDIVKQDLADICSFIEEGGVALGWQNQLSVNRTDSPYAIGGGVTTLRPEIHDLVQQGLKEIAKKYPVKL